MERELERERERQKAGHREGDAERHAPRDDAPGEPRGDERAEDESRTLDHALDPALDPFAEFRPRRRVVRERPALSLVRPRETRTHAVNLDLLYREMHGGLVRYAMRDVDEDEAKDIVHDALLKYLEQLTRQPHLEPEDVARPRLVAMVHDVMLDRKRTNKRRKQLMQLISGSTAAIRRWTNPRRSAEDDEILRSIHEALESMHPSYRVAWTTVKEQGMTPEETADLLGISVGSVRAALHKANVLLRKALTRDGITPATLRGRDDT